MKTDMKPVKKLGRLLLLSVIVIGISGCRMTVSLTGGNINPNATTVYIGTFTNNASLVNPTLSQELTTALKNRVQNQTPLTIVNTNGDYNLEGEITGYTISPIAIQGNETAAMNRLTITIRVSFTNRFDEKDNFEQSFSRYADYISTLNFTSVESTLVEQINEALTDDIFNQAFVNW